MKRRAKFKAGQVVLVKYQHRGKRYGYVTDPRFGIKWVRVAFWDNHLKCEAYGYFLDRHVRALTERERGD